MIPSHYSLQLLLTATPYHKNKPVTSVFAINIKDKLNDLLD